MARSFKVDHYDVQRDQWHSYKNDGIPRPSDEPIKNGRSMVERLIYNIVRQFPGGIDSFLSSMTDSSIWGESGVNASSFHDWYMDYEQEQRQMFQKQAEEKRIREVALAKLTPLERSVLGLPPATELGNVSFGNMGER